MDIGMLWFDNDSQRGLARKISLAAIYYEKKYGKVPSLCFVHPSMVDPESLPAADERIMSGNVEIRPVPWIMPNHVWIGLNGASEKD